MDSSARELRVFDGVFVMSRMMRFFKASLVVGAFQGALVLTGGVFGSFALMESAHAEVTTNEPMFEVMHDDKSFNDNAPPLYVELEKTSDPTELSMRDFAEHGRLLMADFFNQTIASWDLNPDKKMLVEWYFTEALRREGLVREVTDPLYKFKDTFGKDEMDNLIRVRISSQIQSDVEDGYTKAPDVERQEYITKTLKIMAMQHPRNCRFKYAQELPMVDSAETEIFSRAVEHQYIVNSNEYDLQNLLEQRLLLVDYHLDKKRAPELYHSPPKDTMMALMRFMKKSGFKDNVLTPMRAKLTTEYSDEEVCNSYKTFFAIIRDLPGNAGKRLRQDNFPR